MHTHCASVCVCEYLPYVSVAVSVVVPVCVCVSDCVYLRALRVDTNTASSGWAVKVLYNMR